ncbi:MAG: ABC transporter ATP-binding protein [Alphaproteobacteria bacterium]|nr:ABC transporter ATP-binding protein [Alphaproteobacteria bacterium]
MSGLLLSNISKKFGSVTAVTDINLEIPEGRFVSFLGPSGCGKTTLLRLIAGLETATTGRIMLDNEDLTDKPTHNRNIGMVFQSLALFPHLSVGENITYSQRIRGVEKAARRRRAEELLELVRLPGVADRNIAQLSVGQSQRVAIARALNLEPKLFLLDEPLSALDAKLREDMQVELRMLQERLAITTVVVTHDQREAMTMSDEVVVMSTARIQQMGPPLEIYRNPASAFVAEFIGTSNLIKARLDTGSTVVIAGRPCRTEGVPDQLGAGSSVIVSIRPEDVHVYPESRDGTNQLDGVVTFVRDVGASVETFVECDGLQIIAMATPKERPDVHKGEKVKVELPADSCVVLKA